MNNFPDSKVLIKKFIGAAELINRTNRWCLWITDEQKEFAESIPPIKLRIDKVREIRMESKRVGTQKKAKEPHRFTEIQSEPTDALVIPCVSSEARQYIPIEFISDDTVSSNRNQVVFNSPVYLFSLLSSSLHNLWVNAVAGRLETRINYSSLCYNSFAVPDISKEDKNLLSKMSFSIIDVREKYPGQTFAQLYTEKTMPNDLKQAHLENDRLVDKVVLGKNGLSDRERLSMLFKMYRELEKNNA